jgi:hypothetical protein
LVVGRASRLVGIGIEQLVDAARVAAKSSALRRSTSFSD